MQTATFSAPASSVGLRLKRFQRICETSEKDAFLFIAGLDGKYHAGTLMALNYLFCAHSGRDVIDAGKLPESLEDLILVVTPKGVSVFCHELAADGLSALLLPSCNAVQIVCPTKEQGDNPDVYEELKIAAFVQFLRSFQNIGIPLSAEMREGKHINGDPREVDLWPLVQAYGLEGVGKPGFFTQHFQVESTSKAMQQVYCELDSLALQQIVQQQVVNMKKHWIELVINVWQRSPVARSEMTEQFIAEPLTSYFTYGTIRNPMEVRQVVTMPPRVVFGSRTNNDNQQSEEISMKDVLISEGNPCVHMVLEAADPKSPLCVARSYFLSRASLVYNCFAEDEEERAKIHGGGTYDNTDVLYLLQLYSAVVSAAKAAMEHFAVQDGATVQSAREVAEEELVRHASEVYNIHLEPQQLQTQLQFAIWSADHTNRVEPTALRLTKRLKVLRIALKDIRSVASQHRGALLGALVYADTFVEIPAAFGKPAELLNLTSSIPCVGTFSCHGIEASVCNNAKRSFLGWLAAAQKAPAQPASKRGVSLANGGPGPLGPMVSRGAEDAVMLSDNPLRPAEVGTLYVFAHGLVFVSRTACLLVIDFRQHVVSVEVQDLECADAQLPPIGESLVICGKVAACGMAPACHMTKNHHLAIPFNALSQGTRRHVLSKVLPSWQQSCSEADVPWHRSSSGNPFSSAYYAQQWSMVQHDTKQWPLELTDEAAEEACTRLDYIELSTHYSPDLHVEALLRQDRPPPPITSLLTQPCPHHNFSAHPPSLEKVSLDFHCAVTVILVVGLPGGGQELVASVLSQLVGGGPYGVVQHPEKGAASLDMNDLEQVMCNSCSSLCPPGNDTTATLILTTSCHDSIARQLHLLAQTSPFQRGCCKLAAVLAAVSSESFMEDETGCHVLPGGLEQVAPGFVDAIVVAGQKHVRQVQSLLHAHNPSAPLLRASWQVLAKSATQLLPEQEDRQARLHSLDPMMQRRYCSTLVDAPCRGLLMGGLQSVWLRFTGRVDFQRLKEMLSAAGCCNGDRPSTPPAEPTRPVPMAIRPPSASPCYIVFFRALIRTDSSGTVQEVLARHGHGASTFHDWSPLANLLNPPPILNDDQPGGELTVVGTGISMDSVTQMLHYCQAAQPPETQQPKDRGSLTTQELQEIRDNHRFDPLPEGYYFTGSTFVGPFGDTSSDHPHMDKFVTEYLEGARKLQVEEQQAAAAAAVAGVVTVVENKEYVIGTAGTA